MASGGYEPIPTDDNERGIDNKGADNNDDGEDDWDNFNLRARQSQTEETPLNQPPLLPQLIANAYHLKQ